MFVLQHALASGLIALNKQRPSYAIVSFNTLSLQSSRNGPDALRSSSLSSINLAKCRRCGEFQETTAYTGRCFYAFSSADSNELNP